MIDAPRPHGKAALLQVDVAPVERVLLHTQQVCVVDHVSHPEHPHFGGSGPILTPCIGFPRRMCEIAAEGHPPFVSDASRAVFFDAGTVYRRRRMEAAGERATVISVAPVLIDELRDGIGRRTLARVSMPIGAELHQQSVALAQRLRVDRKFDALEAEATALELVGKALASGRSANRGDGAHKPSPQHLKTVALLKDYMRENLAQKVSLAELGAIADVSTFYLCRIFKSVTGESVYQYQLKLRLATALSMAKDYAGNLSALAMDVGFSSHSHLATMFRRVYGISPAQLARRDGRAWLQSAAQESESKR